MAFSDDFNRADSTDLGANWDSGYGGEGALQIVSQRVRGQAAPPLGSIETTPVGVANDQYGQATIATLTGAPRIALEVLLRFGAPGTFSGYVFEAALTGDRSAIYRFDAGVDTLLIAEGVTVWGPSDILRGEAEGSTLRLKRNGTTLLTTTDATYASGRTGLRIFYDTGASLANGEFDDFSMGDLTSLLWLPRQQVVRAQHRWQAVASGMTPSDLPE